MEFTPFKAVPQVISFFEKPQNEDYSGKKNNGSENRSDHSKQKVLRGLQKNIGSKYAFIEKYRLVELKSDLDKNINYYYDQKSKTVLEINNEGPIVFMKSNSEVSKHLLKLNDRN